MSGIRLWRGDICDLEIEAIVVPATPALWMTTGVAAGVKQRGGHGIEFEAVSHAPAAAGTAIATGAGLLASRHVIHAISLTPERRATAAGIDAGTRAALDLADAMGLHAIAIPSLGSPLGGVPLPECARIMLRVLHESLAGRRALEDVVLALRAGPTYDAFRAELGRIGLLRAVPVEPGANAGLVGVMGTADDAEPSTEGLDVPIDRRPEGVR